MGHLQLGLVNFVSRALVLSTLRYSRYDLRVVIYSFVFGILARFLTVEAVMVFIKSGKNAFLRLFTSPPPAEGESSLGRLSGVEYGSFLIISAHGGLRPDQLHFRE